MAPPFFVGHGRCHNRQYPHEKMADSAQSRKKKRFTEPGALLNMELRNGTI